MNASDIVKSKQAKVLHNAYYNPLIFQSTVHSTITLVSSIIDYVSSSQQFTTDSYASTITTSYDYLCTPTFLTYEMTQQVNGQCPPSETAWKNINSTIVYAYSTVYSTFSTPSVPVPSDYYVTSTTVMTGTF